MTESVGPEGPFAPDTVEAVARDHGVDRATLTGLVDRHQRSVESLPGVEEITYEWRKHFDGAVLERTAETYYLSVPDSVWEEFGAALDADEGVLDALIAVHRRTVADRSDLPDEPTGDRAFVVLDRRDLLE